MRTEERVHALFRGAAEIAKTWRTGSLVLEALALGLSLWVIFSTGPALSLWQPLGGFILVGLSEVGRHRAAEASRFAERCRRFSARSYALARPLSAGTLAALLEDAPIGAERAAKRLPSPSLDAYYTPTEQPGPGRVREIYCHSAFYTGRLLKRLGVLQLILSALLVVGTITVMYSLALSSASPTSKLPVLEALTTIVLAVLGLRTLSAALAARAAGIEASGVASALLAHPRPSGLNLERLVDDYDFIRAGGGDVPTWLYKRMRTKISRDWEDVRRLP